MHSLSRFRGWDDDQLDQILLSTCPEHLASHSEALAMVDRLEAHAQTISADQLVSIRDADQSATHLGLVRHGRLYVDVPYEQRNEAKRLLRAQWDREARRWWVDADRITREQGALAAVGGSPPRPASDVLHIA